MASHNPLEYDPEAAPEAYVIETNRDRRGIVVSALIRNGQIKRGDTVYSEGKECKVRALTNDRGAQIPEVHPSTPFAILGFNEMPIVGSLITNSEIASTAVKEVAPKKVFNLQSVLGTPEVVKKLSVIIKADSHGSIEAIQEVLAKNPTVDMVLAGIGDINNADVFLAKSTKSIVIGFNTKPSNDVVDLAKQEKVVIKTYNIIYELLEELAEVAHLLHEKEEQEKSVKGEAKIAATFMIEGQKVFGVRITKGKANTGDTVDLYRDGKKTGSTRLVSLRSRSKQVAEAKKDQDLICIPENPSEDAVASATALYLGLMQLGKNMSIACASPVKSNLIASEKIQGEVTTGGDSLVISFPYTDGSIDKVDYFIQNEQFNIVITPRAGLEKLDQKTVKYNYTGGSIDFIVTIDTTNLRSLGQLYTDNQEQFKGKKLINIDRHLTNSFFGTANYVNRTVSSTAELILGILQTINVQIDQDIATNLYVGVVASTNNYSATTVNAQTFEASAYLLKQGAAKQTAQPQASQTPPTQQPQQQQAPQPVNGQANQSRVVRPQQSRQPVRQQASQQPQMEPSYAPAQPREPQQASQQQMQQAPVSQQPQQTPGQTRSFERPKSARPVGAIERDQIAHMAEGNDQSEDEDNEEWLKPKIFKPQGPGTGEMG
ncbi:DHH family phosphoesterase [Candidatus Microgenomates bacterium]|nr:DHH family phosphoesterase [Candidatus Microgenomates bacterium]